MIIRNALIFLILTTAISVFAQDEIIPEENIDFTITKWFYSQYPKSTKVIWSKVNSATTKERVQVKFYFEEQNMSAIYNVDGVRILETREVKQTPISLVNHIYENYEKAKIRSVKKKVDFTSDRITYEMNVKSKSKGLESLVFDEEFQLVATFPVSSSN